VTSFRIFAHAVCTSHMLGSYLGYWKKDWRLELMGTSFWYGDMMVCVTTIYDYTVDIRYWKSEKKTKNQRHPSKLTDLSCVNATQHHSSTLYAFPLPHFFLTRQLNNSNFQSPVTGNKCCTLPQQTFRISSSHRRSASSRIHHARVRLVPRSHPGPGQPSPLIGQAMHGVQRQVGETFVHVVPSVYAYSQVLWYWWDC
jgi:hypothetical protein